VHSTTSLCRPGRRRRVAFIIQRYGSEANGGAERHCRMVVERLAASTDVVVLTTCALDPWRWDNHFPPGRTMIADVPVIRFPVCLRQREALVAWTRRLTQVPIASKVELALLPRLRGPYAPGLVRYLATAREHYDAFIFFCCTLYPTQVGLPVVAHHAALVPTAHDVPSLTDQASIRVLSLARRLLVNTPEEGELIRRRVPSAAPLSVIGCGVDPSSANGAREPNQALRAHAWAFEAWVRCYPAALV
jgi:hypothetical protein